jgi:undecaprenyl-diphosphatase
MDSALMPLYQVLIYAIVQGITEFLPISSSAHLELIPKLFGWVDPGLEFDIALHVGTLIAVLGYFTKDWIQIAGQGFGFSIGTDEELKRNRMLLWLLAVGSIPIGIAGVIFKKKAEGEWRNQLLIGIMLVVIGIVMWIGERVGRHKRDIGAIGWFDAAVIGIAQALAVVPGTSRSGITITAGLFRNLNRDACARFSFLLATPTIAAAALLDVWSMRKTGGIPADMRMPFIVGILVSAIVGAIVIGFFLRYLKARTLYPFIYYRIVFGIIVIALALFR